MTFVGRDEAAARDEPPRSLTHRAAASYAARPHRYAPDPTCSPSMPAWRRPSAALTAPAPWPDPGRREPLPAISWSCRGPASCPFPAVEGTVAVQSARGALANRIPPAQALRPDTAESTGTRPCSECRRSRPRGGQASNAAWPLLRAGTLNVSGQGRRSHRRAAPPAARCALSRTRRRCSPAPGSADPGALHACRALFGW